MRRAPEILRREMVAALRGGTVPRRGLAHLTVGLERYEEVLDEELERAALGEGVFKAVRGDYGAGKTFFSRWLQHRAQQAGFATAEVQISASETPLHRMEKVYRRAMEGLRTREWRDAAFRSLVDRWFYALEEEVLERPGFPGDDAVAVSEEVGRLLEARLRDVGDAQSQFAAALRACHASRATGDTATADGLLAWLSGQPHVAASVKRVAGVKGDVDHYAAHAFLRGLLSLLKQTGRRGLVLVLDEVETIQRMRADVRELSLDALRKWMDELSQGRFPGLYLVITGTPEFFEGYKGVKALAPLYQRLKTRFDADPRFDNLKSAQIRLLPFDRGRLLEVGRKVRALYPGKNPDRVAAAVDDPFLEALVDGVTQAFGGRVEVGPRLFLRELVDVIDRVDAYEDYDPRERYELAVEAADLTPVELDAWRSSEGGGSRGDGPRRLDG